MARAAIDLSVFLADPFATLARAREQSWLADLEGGLGTAVAVTTHEDVRQLLTDPRLEASFTDFLASIGITSGTFYEWMAISPLNKDGAEHQRWRALMGRTFTPRRVEAIRPFLRRAAHDLIGAFAARGRCEFVGEFADAYPSLGLCELIGVPQADRDRFRQWANAVGLGFSPLELLARIGEVDAALDALIAYAGELVALRRAEPRDDLVSRLALAAEEDGWSVREVQSFIAGLVFAGHETTKNQLGWMIAVLAGRDEVWDGVTAGALGVADVVEEVLRFQSAITGVGRTVAAPIEHKGERLAAGTRVVLSLWGADRDGAAYPAPDDLDARRRPDVPHLAFGHGAHFCLGAALARAELQEALAALASRLGCPTLADGAAWRPAVGITGPLRLPITFAERRTT